MTNPKPANPVLLFENLLHGGGTHCVTLRDLFACFALRLSNEEDYEKAASMAYEVADAMLEAREARER